MYADCHWDVEINKPPKSLPSTTFNLNSALQYANHQVPGGDALGKHRFSSPTSGTYKHLPLHPFDLGMAALQWDILYLSLVQTKPEDHWLVISYYFERWLHIVQCSSIAANHLGKSRSYITPMLQKPCTVTSVSPVLLVMLDWTKCTP